jgi:dTDP-4-dehydrorhamnose reductase
VSKAELLSIIAEVFKHDVLIREVEAPEAVDRTLSTDNPHLNEEIWKAAGYDTPPTIRQMIEELYESLDNSGN